MKISGWLLAVAVLGVAAGSSQAEKGKDERRSKRVEVEKVHLVCDGDDCPDDDDRGPDGGPGRGLRSVRDPELRAKLDKIRDLEVQIRELGDKLRGGEATARAEARKAIGALFDAKLALEEAMLAKMEKGAARMRARIDKKKAGRDKMIDRRLARVAGEDEDEW